MNDNIYKAIDSISNVVGKSNVKILSQQLEKDDSGESGFYIEICEIKVFINSKLADDMDRYQISEQFIYLVLCDLLISRKREERINNFLD